MSLNWPPFPPPELNGHKHELPPKPEPAEPRKQASPWPAQDHGPAASGWPAPPLPGLPLPPGLPRAADAAAWSVLDGPQRARPGAAATPEPPLAAPAAGLADPRLIAGVTEVTAMIASQLDDGASAAEVMPAIRESARRWLELQVRSGLLPASVGGEVDKLASAVHDQRYGLGPVTAYLRDPQVENVDINGCDHVWITYASGERVAGPPVAASDDALIAMIRTWATRGGQTARDFSAAAPLVNVALTGSARLTATMSVTPRPCVSLRRHGQIDVNLTRLTQLGTVDATVAAFLAAAVRSRCNVIITGGVNAGKTTLLRALASEIPAGERIATLESEYELFLHGMAQHPDVIAFEAREANSEGAGGITLHDLIAHALRHNPRRILVGEVRRSEIMPMLEAMNSGQDGSMCTMHANSPAEAFDRILILGLRGGLALAERAIHILVGMAVDLVVHIRRGYDGTRTVRYVSEILEVMPPGDTERPAVNRLFLPDPHTGRAMAAHTPSAGLLNRLSAAGFDAGLLDHQRSQYPVQSGWQR
jgi:Flp pilus assembly CpaF family ATPase